jgi:hypothetical protein
MDGAIQKVFISYAWESEEYKRSIWDLAAWIQFNSKLCGIQVDVVTDHLFSSRPPQSGWHRWMENAIEEANIVLVACSSSYAKFFAGRDNDCNRGGFGATHEGTIIRAEMIEQKGLNNKFYPILPNEGNVKDIPKTLAAYFNGLRFDANYQGILELIIGNNPKHTCPDITDNDRATAEISEEIIALKDEVAENIIDKIEIVVKDDPDMSYDVQVLLRAYLSLNDIDKIWVIKENISDFEEFEMLPQFEKDKKFLMRIDNAEKLQKLWDSINRLKSFDDDKNPFN